MADWLKVEFYAQLPDGLIISEADDRQTSEELARVFGFSRVDGVQIKQVSGDEIATRRLVDERPRQAFRGPDHPGHASRGFKS